MDRLFPLEEKHAFGILPLSFCFFLCLFHVAYLVDTQCRLTRLRYHFLWLSHSFCVGHSFLSCESWNMVQKGLKRGLIHGYI